APLGRYDRERAYGVNRGSVCGRVRGPVRGLRRWLIGRLIRGLIGRVRLRFRRRLVRVVLTGAARCVCGVLLAVVVCLDPGQDIGDVGRGVVVPPQRLGEVVVIAHVRAGQTQVARRRGGGVVDIVGVDVTVVVAVDPKRLESAGDELH